MEAKVAQSQRYFVCDIIRVLWCFWYYTCNILFGILGRMWAVNLTPGIDRAKAVPARRKQTARMSRGLKVLFTERCRWLLCLFFHDICISIVPVSCLPTNYLSIYNSSVYPFDVYASRIPPVCIDPLILAMSTIFESKLLHRNWRTFPDTSHVIYYWMIKLL